MNKHNQPPCNWSWFYYQPCYNCNSSLSSSPAFLSVSSSALSSVSLLRIFVLQRLLAQLFITLFFAKADDLSTRLQFLKSTCPSDAFVTQGIIDQATFGTEEEIHFRPPVFAKWAGATTGRIGWKPQPHKVESTQSVGFVSVIKFSHR